MIDPRRLNRVVRARTRLRDIAASDSAVAEAARRDAEDTREQRSMEREQIVDSVGPQMSAANSALALELLQDQAIVAGRVLVAATAHAAERGVHANEQRARLYERERQLRGTERKLEAMKQERAKAVDKAEQVTSDELSAQAPSRDRR